MYRHQSSRPCSLSHAHRDRRSPRSLAVLGVGLLLWTSPGTGGASSRGELFERHTVTTGAGQQTVLSGFFRGGEFADLVVLRGDSEHPELEMFGYDGGAWASVLRANLPPEVLFVDVARIARSDHLLLYTSGRMLVFDPDTSDTRPLADISTRYNRAPEGLYYGGFESRLPFDAGEIPRVDVTRDLNGDGRDDLVLPDVDGFFVAVQKADGTFSQATQVGPPEPFRDGFAQNETRPYGEVGITPLTAPLYLSRLYQADFDLDGRIDLVFWNEDHFEAHLQDASGEFSPEPTVFDAGVPFDTDADYSLAFTSPKVTFASVVFGIGKKQSRTILRAVTDMNGDGVADLVTHSVEGKSALRLRSRYTVYFGERGVGGTTFSTERSTTTGPRGRAAGGFEAGGYSSLWLRDLDGDGQTDILRGDVKISLSAMLRAMLGTSIGMRAEMFLMQEGAYPERASVARSVRSDLSIRGSRDAGFFPSVLVGDVNGDGRSDILVGKNRRKLHVYLGAPEPEIVARRPVVVDVALPGDERNSWLTDLNGDGKLDVLLHRSSVDAPHRVTMLVAR